ncbi:MAG: MFS transporter, partial [Actinobacteria bacterium]|nr:MFS transporter [Actinomycetota bacterium]
NISTIYAYMADITKPQDRGKYFGMLGAAGGFGMVFGPVIGGFGGTIHLSVPIFIAAGITFIDMVFGYFILPESLAAEHKTVKFDFKHLNPSRQFGHVLSINILKRLFLSGFIFFVAINAMYANNSVFLKDVFNWGPSQIGILLFTIGIVDIFTQGFLIRKLLPKFGDLNVNILGLLLTFVGFVIAASNAIIVSAVLIYVGLIIINIGDGLVEPSSSSLISTAVGPKMQGRVSGANQGMQSVARVIGPFLSAWIYRYWKGLPYASEAMLIIFALVILLISIPIIKSHRPEDYS